jgi:tRNA (guanine37-N1)-methyltransferase
VSPSLQVDVVTIFPAYLSPLDLSLIGKARERGLVETRVHDLRNVTTDVHHTVDDAPYGGGPGMVMRPEPWWAVLEPMVTPATRVIVPSPSGQLFTQARAAKLARAEHLVFACGRYEGIDQRVLDHFATDVLSLGDYVLAGGEVATLVMLEAIIRLIPGVVGNAESIVDDSFGDTGSTGLLEGPVYTRPPVHAGGEVPPVLLSGDHGAIARWRRDEALRRTRDRRPDLLANLVASDRLSDRDRAALEDVGQ